MLAAPAAGCLVFLQESPSQALRKQETQNKSIETKMLCGSNMTTQKFSANGRDTHHTFHVLIMTPFLYSPSLYNPNFQTLLKNCWFSRNNISLHTPHSSLDQTYSEQQTTPESLENSWILSILSLRPESLDTHMFPVNKACTGISKYHSLHFLCGEIFNVEKFSLWRSFLCGEIFCVPIYRAENNPNILTPIKKTLNVKPQAKRKFIAWHYTDIYRLSNWPSFLVPIGTFWSLGLRQ